MSTCVLDFGHPRYDGVTEVVAVVRGLGAFRNVQFSASADF